MQWPEKIWFLLDKGKIYIFKFIGSDAEISVFAL